MIDGPRPLPPTEQWFYIRDCKRFGPTDREGLQEMARLLHLRRECELFKDAESTPILAATLEGLAFPAEADPGCVHDHRYGRLYRSSDDRLLLGECGGLAHRWGVPTVLVRSLMVLLAVFGWVYPLCWLLPALPTKGMPRETRGGKS